MRWPSRFTGGFFGRFSNMRIRSQLLMVYSIAGLLPMLLLGALLVGNTGRLALQQYYSQAAADNKRVKMIIFDVTYLVTNMAETIFYDDRLKEIVSRKYTDDSQVYQVYRNYTLLDSYLANYTEISGITIYVNNQTMLTNGRFKVVTDDDRNSDWYRLAAGSAGGGNLWIVNSALGSASNLRLVRKIPMTGGADFAVLVISVSNNYLKLMINDNSYQTIAALDGDRIFFSDDTADIGGPIPIRVDVGNPQAVQTGDIKYKGTEAIYSACVQSAVKAVNSFQIVTIDRDAPGKIRAVVLNGVLIVAISLAVPYVLILLFLNVFSRRIVTLRGEMHKVASGDLNIIDSFNGRDELSDVYADMKTMIGCIQNLYLEIYNEKLTKEKLATRQQRIEFEMLASQINPHFLFNTLETIRMKAHINNDEEVAYITKLLGKSIRRVLEVGSDPVSLASELKYVKIYMDIQIFRYHEKINYTLNVARDVCADGYQILPLLLQPIVENSIVHGLENKKGGGWIGVGIGHTEGFLAIAVSDNGVGMSREQKRALEDMMRGPDIPQSRGSIGLANVYQRIKLFYGQEYGMEIKSDLDEGTVVTLLLPPYEKRVENVAGSDR
jgi:two-component system sensor histidine kinase YesM